MKFCQHSWVAKKYQDGDTTGKPSGTKTVYCELEEDHRGDHRAGGSTTPSNMERKVKVRH